MYWSKTSTQIRWEGMLTVGGRVEYAANKEEFEGNGCLRLQADVKVKKTHLPFTDAEYYDGESNLIPRLSALCTM